MRVAIVHYWLVGMRGGEKVVEALCRLYPQADIFTHVYDSQAMSPTISAHTIKTSFISRLPLASHLYKRYLPLMPLALEQLDLRGYDLIISSESGPSKGIIPPSGALHICYCHSPMRYIWNMFHEYRERSGWMTRLVMPPIAHYLRNWDALSAMRVHDFVANSRTVAHRLQTYYRREAEIIYPPVDVDDFHSLPKSEIADFYLMAGELVSYKRPELAVQAFNRSGRKLVVIGGGENLAALRALAGPNVSILGPQPFSQLRDHYARCRALVFPGEEDFGIVPVEAMASGRPVLAFNRGGATETVVEGVTGTFFSDQSVAGLNEGLDRLERMSFDPAQSIARSRDFASDLFRSKFQGFVSRRMAQHQRGILTPLPERMPVLQPVRA